MRNVTPEPRRTSGVRGLVVLVLAALLLSTGGVETAGAAKLRKMFWGPVDVAGASQFPLYRKLGVDVYQTAITWKDAAPTRPKDPTDPNDPAYVWPAVVDRAVDQAARNGMKVGLMLFGAPGWANGGQDEFHGPRRPSDFAAFAEAAARRYPQVHVWMIWGEANSGIRFQPMTGQTTFTETRLSTAQARAPRAYARLVDAAYGGLKAANRANLVVGGMSYSAGDIRAANWVRNLRLPNGRPPRMDLYGHNAFGLRQPDLRKPASPQQVVDMSDLRRFQRVIDARLARPRGKRRIRLYLSEYSIPTKPDREFGYYTTEKLQAAWIPDAFRVAHQLGAWGLGWIHLYDGDNVGSGTFSGLLRADGSLKPGFDAFRRAK